MDWTHRPLTSWAFAYLPELLFCLFFVVWIPIGMPLSAARTICFAMRHNDISCAWSLKTFVADTGHRSAECDGA